MPPHESRLIIPITVAKPRNAWKRDKINAQRGNCFLCPRFMLKGGFLRCESEYFGRFNAGKKVIPCGGVL